MGETFILELTKSHISCIVQLLHLGIVEEQSDQPFDALVALASQADSVYKDPERHNVFPEMLKAPARAVEFKNTFYIPVV